MPNTMNCSSRNIPRLRNVMASVLRIAILLAAILVISGMGCATADGPSQGPSATAAPTPHPFQVVRQVPTQVLPADSPITDASPPLSAPDRPQGAFGFSRYVFEEVGGEVMATLVEGPLGEQVRAPLSYRQLQEILRDGTSPPGHSKVSRPELQQLVDQLDGLREATEKYRNIAVARSEGFSQVGVEVPNMGAHFMNFERIQDGAFDPTQPEILMYARDENGDWQLKGTAFILLTQQFGREHPVGFAGPLDNWHVHYSVCGGGPEVVPRASTREDCESQGGLWASSFGWMIHAWVWEDNPLGVFSMWNPNVPPLASGADVRDARDISQSTEHAEAVPISNVEHTTVRTRVGKTVEWTNLDGMPHTVTIGPGQALEGVDSGLIAPGQSFGVRFDVAGAYPYFCTLHPSMRGSVEVSP